MQEASLDCVTLFRLQHLVKTSIPVTLMCGGVERGVGAGEGFVWSVRAIVSPTNMKREPL